MTEIKKMKINRDLTRFQDAIINHKQPIGIAGGVAGLLVLLTYALGAETTKMIIKTEGIPNFKNASILGNPGEKVLQGEQSLFSRQQRDIIGNQKTLQDEVTKLRGQLDQLQAASVTPGSGTPSPSPSGVLPSTGGVPPVSGQSTISPIKLSQPGDDYGSTHIQDSVPTAQAVPGRESLGLGLSNLDTRKKKGKPGANIVSFPVKTSGAVYLKRPGIVLPSGSYVKAKLLTGVEAPEGKTYPALLQLDYAYVIPNHKRLDLAGCFAIAKAQGDLSTERVQMQAVKLSCVSSKGGFFEREVNGFVADDTDNSFAVMGTVNTKQDRVAAMAFLSSVVTGISKAVQQSQTTQQATPLGGGQSIVTGDQAKYIGAGGAAEAASMVSQWYLKQAQNLLPTINVGSGQDVWVIMQDSVDLPKDYFAQNSEEGVGHASIYSYFTRIME